MSGNLRILLVEDNPADADLLQEGLSALGEPLEIARAQRMDEAVEHLCQGRPADALLLDLGLPDSQGLATLQRALEAADHLPIIDVATRLEQLARSGDAKKATEAVSQIERETSVLTEALVARRATRA